MATIDRPTSASSGFRAAARWAWAGPLFLTLAALLSAKSGWLWDHTQSDPRIYLAYAAGLVAVGIAYLVMVWLLLRHLRSGRMGASSIAWIVGLGLAMRAVLLPSAPVLETDSFRYRWDGALTAHGISPYRYNPTEAQQAVGQATSELDPRIVGLAREAGPVFLEHINHPGVNTIYPPVAQAAFALAYLIQPWGLEAWRAILLIADAAVLILLLKLLRLAGLPLGYVAIYWWNPLAVREFYCGAHMDVLVLAPVLLAVWASLAARPVLAGASLAVAVGVKFWPLLLLPLVLRRASGDRRRRVAALIAFTAVGALALAPMIFASGAGMSGAAAYTKWWQCNDGLFSVGVWLWEQLLPRIGVAAWRAQPVARIMTAVIVAGWVLRLASRSLDDPRNFTRACLLAVAVAFLLSPTQFPWYYTWLLPLLAMHPRWSLLLYTALLPLYYLWFDNPAVGWAEHGPVVALFAWEAFAWHRRTAETPRGKTYSLCTTHA